MEDYYLPKNILDHGPVQDFIFNDDFYDRVDELARKFGVSGERSEELLTLHTALLKRQISIEKILTMVQQAFGLPEDKAQALTRDFVGYLLLPLEKYAPEVVDALQKLGGKVEDYPADRVAAEEKDANAVVEAALQTKGLSLPESLHERLVFLTKAYLEGRRDRESTKKLLMRGDHIGGLGMAEGSAEGLLAEFDTQLKTATVVASTSDLETAKEQENVDSSKSLGMIGDEELSGPVATRDSGSESGMTKNDASDPPPNVGGDRGGLLEPDRKSPSETIDSKAKLEGRTESENAIQPNPITEEAYEDVLADRHSEQSEASTQAKRKQETPPNKQSAATKQPSTLPVKAMTHALTKEVPVIAGESLKRAKLVRQASKPRTGHDDSIDTIAEEITEQMWPHVKGRMKKGSLLQVVTSGLRGVRDERKIERLLAETYRINESVASEMAADIVSRKEGYELTLRSQPTPNTQDYSVKQTEKTIEAAHAVALSGSGAQKIDPVNDGVRVSAARTKEQEQTLQLNRIPEKAHEVLAEQQKPAPAPVKLSEQSVHESRDGKQKVTDVTYKKRLVGPIEELESMNLVMFRRLARKPDIAVEELDEKLGLLEEESYAKRVEGVKAWRKSPVNQLYVAMTQEALMKGKSTAEIAAERRGRGEEALSPSELQAIMKFNEQNRF